MSEETGEYSGFLTLTLGLQAAIGKPKLKNLLNFLSATQNSGGRFDCCAAQQRMAFAAFTCLSFLLLSDSPQRSCKQSSSKAMRGPSKTMQSSSIAQTAETEDWREQPVSSPGCMMPGLSWCCADINERHGMRGSCSFSWSAKHCPGLRDCALEELWMLVQMVTSCATWHFKIRFRIPPPPSVPPPPPLPGPSVGENDF